jgi:hypothetical protein
VFLKTSQIEMHLQLVVTKPCVHILHDEALNELNTGTASSFYLRRFNKCYVTLT